MAGPPTRSPRPLAVLVAALVPTLAAAAVLPGPGTRSPGTSAGGSSAVLTDREGLPRREPTGYYHEYTVATPGSADRGARRTVAGGGGGRYCTDDHYSSFREVLP